MSLPDAVEPYRKKGEDALHRGAVTECLFSGPTYQVEVQDKNKKHYVFIQCDDGAVKDLFCSCEESTEKGACSHMAAACLSIFPKGKLALHNIFKASFWRIFFFLIFERVMRDDIRLDAGKVLSSTGKCVGKIKGFEPLWQPNKKPETEENSIKFSSLSEDELIRYKEGRPSIDLQFELSPLSEVAKSFFFLWLENKENVTITFSPVDTIPTSICIEAKKQSVAIELSEEEILEIVPYLDTLTSNLTFFPKGTRQLHDAIFEEEGALLSCGWKKKALRHSKKETCTFGPYEFIPNKGFTTQNHETEEETFEGQEIGKCLDQYQDDLRKVLAQPVQEKERDFSYTLELAAKKLIITPYFEKPGDVVHFFGHWAFTYRDGFVPVRCPKFDRITIISQKELSSFILMHREWLQQFEGFAVHLQRVHQEISYVMTDRALIFTQNRKEKKSKATHEEDIGDFVYRQGEGFFIKEAVTITKELPFNEPIASFQVADFIRTKSDVLATIPQFFMVSTPIAEMQLHIYLRKKGRIAIEPTYTFLDPNEEQKAHFFDEYVYIENRGFYRLSFAERPLEYIQEISSTTSQWNYFFLELLPLLKKNFKTDVDPQLEPGGSLSLLATNIKKKGVHSWDAELFLGEGNEKKTSLKDVLQAVKRKERFIPSERGLVDIEDERFFSLKKLLLKYKGNTFSLNTLDFFALRAFLGLEILGEEGKEFSHIFDLKEVSAPSYPLLQASLREYQSNGVEWLWFLYKNSLSGLLCDDMGVGKTHQAMGLLASVLEEQQERPKGPRFLVVVPTSLLFHWEEKLHAFLPTLKVKLYTGAMRHLEDLESEKYDLILTSYGIFRTDHKKFHEQRFEVAIFDELQIAKNHVSQIYAALRSCRARMRLGMTGTPIENEIRELKALFDIVLPGYMFYDEDFREFFITPIEKHGNFERRSLLQKYVKPFILRRRKCDVLKDLPEKIEEIYTVELSEEQRDLYKEVAANEGRPLIKILEDEAAPLPYFHIFALIAALKQICNHPASYVKDVDNFERYSSGKWDACVELIEEAFESGQKVVIFSQYLAMLDIMGRYCKENDILYSEIRGKTLRRQEEVRRFQDNPKCRIFLGSLQAAGLGIDLTAASVVIHYDRWWNSSRENQATDRVHRIGQVRGVQVFKFITRGTIEEKIDELIARKKDLVEHVITVDDHAAVKKLSRSELLSIVRDITEAL